MLATLKFLADLPTYAEEKPFTLYGFPEHVKPQTNCEYELRDHVLVEDARGHEKDYTLDGCGFEFHRRPSKCLLQASIFESIEGREEVWKYLKETISLGEALLGASKVLCFDWRLRRTNADCDIKGQIDNLESARYRALSPASLMHCDYSYDGGLETLKIHLSEDEFAGLSEGKYRAMIANIWRPLQRVQCTPLILCDRRTVQVGDILDVDQVAPTKVEQSMTLKYRETQKYHWLSCQEPEEIILFTSWNSIQDEGFASHTPHAANIDDPTNDTRRIRESVEVRLVALWLSSDNKAQ